MADPLPPDPYLALAVPKDADITAIRSAHRKLVLKFHPDRIKNPADQERGRQEFDKVQQAYELLSDSVQRERYDNRVKLAEYKREQAMREPPSRSATYPGRPSPTTPYRDYSDVSYEERVPASAYTDSRDHFEEEFSRASSRKYAEYEPRNAGRSAEKESKSRGKWDGPTENMSYKMAFNLKKKATAAREKVQENKMREKEEFAAKAKARAREERQSRSEKRYQPFVQEDSSDSDTATQVTNSTIRPSRASPKSRPTTEAKPKRTSASGRPFDEEGEEDNYDDWDKYERLHEESRKYQTHARPSLSKNDSKYWESEEARRSSRRSGSDSDRRPSSSAGRRSEGKETQPRPPPMPTHTSAPSNLRPQVETREPQMRSNTSTAVPREKEHRRDMPPTFERSKTMPTSRSKKDAAPARGSNLKHAETHDSGYGSSSSPHTPDMSGDSPTREGRRELPRQSSTRYAIVDPIANDDGDEFPRKHRTVLIDPEDDHRHRRRSPSPQLRERERRPERPRLNTTDNGRSRSARVSSGQPASEHKAERPANVHRDSRFASPHNSPPPSRNNSGRAPPHFPDASPEEVREPAYTHRYMPESVRTAPRVDSDNINYANYKRKGSSDERIDRDFMPNSRHREQLKGSRRPSLYT